MAIIGTYSVNNDPNTFSNLYDNVDEILLGLPDNNQNLIRAINVRDAVYTLYEYTNTIVASSSVTASLIYNSATPSTYVGNVGGVSQGSTFSGSIQDVLDRIFYPYVAPSSSISLVSTTPREFGSSNNVTLSWSVVRNSNTITPPIIIDRSPIPILIYISPTGNSQTDTVNTSGTHSLTPGVSYSNTFTITVGDGTSTTSSSIDLVWMNRIYWGRINLSSINPNLTTNPGSASLVGSFCTDSIIKGLDGADANNQAFGSLLSTTKDRTYNGIDGNGWHLIFAWPSNVAGAFTPTFTVNGMISTAFTRVRTNSPFSNNFSFVSNYEVWVSNTLQNSPLNIIIS